MLRRSLLLWCRPVLLRGSLTLLLGSRLALLLLLNGLALLLLLDRLMLLLLLNRLVLLLLLNCLVLWLHRGRLALPLLLLHRGTLVLLLHRGVLMLLLLLHRGGLMLLLRWSHWALLLLHRMLLLLRRGLIACFYHRRHTDVAIGRERLVDDQAGWTAMVHAGKLSSIGAGGVLILQLRTHGRSVLFLASRQFRRSGAHLQAARSAVETHTDAAPIFVHRTVVDVMYVCDVHIVDRAIVVEVAAAPIAALVTEAYVPKAIVDTAVVADVRTPVATVEAVAVM